MRYNYNGLRVSQDVGLDSRAGVTEEKREIRPVVFLRPWRYESLLYSQKSLILRQYLYIFSIR